ncbi:MAG: hypothetical protein WCP34_17125 [Pseudomonadota bacterium]
MNDDTLLLRQIHPCFVQEGRVSSQAFRPTPKDAQRLSVYDGDRINAQSAYQHYTTTLCFQSVGVLGVTVVECNLLQLPVSPDPEEFPEHMVIDFSAFNKSTTEKKAKHLRAKAEARDWLYRGLPA